MAINTFKFMTLENLATYHGELTAWTQSQIAEATANSIKTVSMSNENGVYTMHFYTVEEPVGEVQAAYSIELPSDYYTEAEVDAFVSAINEAVEAVDAKADAAQEAAEDADAKAQGAQDAVDALSEKVGADAIGDKTVIGYVDEKVAEAEGLANDAQSAADKAQGDVDALKAKVGEVPEDSETVIAYINKKTEGIATDAALGELQSALGTANEELEAIKADYLKASDKTELEGEIADAVAAEESARVAKDNELAASIKTISDDYLTSADKTELTDKDAELEAAIATEKARMDAFMKLEDGQTLNDALDSLKELQDYITSEAAEADEIMDKVAALEAIVDGIGGEGEEATVVAYVTKAIEALKIGDYAKAADLAAAVDRIAANEKAITDMDAAYKAADEKVVSDMTALVEAEEARALAAEAKAQADAEAKAAELDATLKGELQGEIAGVDAKFAEYSKASAVSAEIDADVLVETNRAKAAEEALEGRVAELETVTHSVSAIDTAEIEALFA